VGSIVVSGGGPRGPIQPLETATLPDTTTPEHRTDLFALSGIMERLARFSGSLSAALPPVFVTVFGVSHLGGFKIMFIGYTVLMLASAVMYSFLSPAVEHVAVKGGWQNPLKLQSRRTIFTLAAIFSLDSFATRFVFFSLVALWFRTQYGLDLAELSYLLASTTILGGISLWASAKLANRIGLLNTIVFTHIPAVLFTIAVPFAPTAWLAVTLWLARGFFSSMDNPPRQSYIMAIVNREERAAMASVSNVSQAATGAATPLLATVLMQGLAAGAPFVVSGVIKSVYLVGLYLMFKDVHPPEEVARIEARRRRAESRSSGSEAPK
jgi:predicted MFS family arabinose efflux permease